MTCTFIDNHLSISITKVNFKGGCLTQVCKRATFKIDLVVGVERWLPYKGACRLILLAKLHDMYLYKTDTFSTSTTI